MRSSIRLKLTGQQLVAIAAMIEYLCTSIERENYVRRRRVCSSSEYGQIGRVIGYGHQILNGVSITTLKV